MANSKLANAVRIALISAGAAGAGAYSLGAAAQQTETQQRSLEEIVVTGTRIRSPGLVANSPISSVDQTELQFRQPASAEDFIRELPSAIPALGPGTNNGTGGGSTVNLRGLGSNRNLLLFNGRRIVPFNLDGVVDTNFVPIALLDRTDLVTGGASAVYGADAISGVINFISRQDFEGVEFSGRYGTSERGDADRTTADIIFGANTSDGRGNITMSFGYTDTESLRMGERNFGVSSLSSATGNPSGSSAGVPTFSVLRVGAVDPETGIPATVLAQYDPALGAFSPNFTLFNFNPLNFYQGPLERTQGTAMARYEVAPFAEAYGEFLFMNNTRKAQLAPSGSFFNNWNISVDNPFLNDVTRQQLCLSGTRQVGVDGDGDPIIVPGQIAPADCVAGSDEIIQGVQLRRRFTELGPRLNDFDNQIFQYTAGIRGDITSSWDYDVYWSRGQADQSQVRGNWGSNSRVQQALLATTDPVTGAPVCIDPSNGCVPLNLFGPEGSITDEMIDFFNLSSLLAQEVVQEIGSASVSGDLGDIRSPWADSPIGVALGVEHRRVSASTRSDQASQVQAEVLGTGAPTPDRSGSYKLNEVFVEMLAPVLPGVIFEGGYRHSQFTVEDSQNYGSWKAGLAWEPIDSLRLRTMFQRATRSPNVNELFAPQVSGLSNLDTDPCQGAAISSGDASTAGTLSNLCRLTGVPVGIIGSLPAPAAGQINVLTGGNPALNPEEANTWTVGFVWQPTMVDDLTLTVDYYRIKLTDQVSSPSSTDILDQCYSTTFNPSREFNAACALVQRSPIGGDLNASDSPGVVTALSNSGRSTTDGIDLGAVYGLELPNGRGGLTFSINVTHVLNWDFQANPTATDRDCVGFYSVACNDATGSGMVHKTRFNQRTTWSLNAFDVSVNWRYMSGMSVEPGAGNFLPAFSSISATSYFDLSGAWRATDNVRVLLTVNNALDKKPPVVGDTIGSTAVNSGNTFPQYYDVLGRFYNLGVNISF